jgi:hypothetical protein
MQMLWRRPSAATVIAGIALFVALGGNAAASDQPAVISATPIAFHTLTLQNGWVGKPFATRVPAVAKDSGGTVHLRGAMSSGGSAVAFTLPLGFRPPVPVYVTVDMCNATQGRLFIQPNGVVMVQAESAFTNAQCFTSLEGVVFGP